MQISVGADVMNTPIRLEDVFGVTSRPIRSYVERNDIDSRFREALRSGKQIVVYGSSKQGKTALVSKHLPYDDNLLVSLTPKTQLIDIYQRILNAAGVRLVAGATEKSNTDASVGIGTRFKAMIPIFGSAEAEAKGEFKTGSGKEVRYDEIPINLELPQSVADLLDKVGCSKFVILENFHYLNDEIQRQFAFDLRAFQELGVRFVILGVWREKNRMAQFNGDLLDRIIEVPVEPWRDSDFLEVVARGSTVLNIEIYSHIVQGAIEASFSSIGVFQELLKAICIEAGAMHPQTRLRKVISDSTFLAKAIETKTHDYASRHQRALEAIAAGHTTGGAKGDLQPLYLPYYLVQVVLKQGFSGISNGMHRSTLHDGIKEMHHRGDDVRSSDMTNLLDGLANLQAAKFISPPIIDFDKQNRMLQVVDSTFYFFIKHVDLAEVADAIPNPLQ
ncbi:hypothetical protein ABH945_007007 [Paraburkholderia sp. GAS333]|uniref:hypothetical protein n=1 Tax=Paraburkholderia sp. GAS333 TaxID=3156279 RepID=UPI003D21532E